MIKELSIEILKEMQNMLEKCLVQEDSFIELIRSADRIFVAGVGRTGYIMRCFSMRLMHVGFQSYMVGDTETPGAKKNDLLIVGSGSGETESLKAYVSKAEKIGMKIIVLTANKESVLAKTADSLCLLPAPIKHDLQENSKSAQPMGALFEQSLLVFLDALVMRLMALCHVIAEDMYQNHANLE